MADARAPKSEFETNGTHTMQCDMTSRKRNEFKHDTRRTQSCRTFTSCHALLPRPCELLGDATLHPACATVHLDCHLRIRRPTHTSRW
eukprot:2565816-Prymnesium_polylepis.1